MLCTNSTYDVLMHFCKHNEISICFYQKHSAHMYPEFSFGSEELQKQLFTPLSTWFIEGSGTMPWSNVTLVFTQQNGSLGFRFEDCEIDEEYFDPEDEYDYLLDVDALRDGKPYSID